MYATATTGNAISLKDGVAVVYRKRLGRNLAIHRCTKPLARATPYATEGLLLRFQPSMPSMSGSEHVQRTCSGQKSRASVCFQQFEGLWLPDWRFLRTTTLLAFSGIIRDINGGPAIPQTSRYLGPLLDQMYTVATYYAWRHTLSKATLTRDDKDHDRGIDIALDAQSLRCQQATFVPYPIPSLLVNHTLPNLRLSALCEVLLLVVHNVYGRTC